MPIYCLSILLQAINVLPLQAKGSNTIAHSLDTSFTRYSIRAIGLTVGWLLALGLPSAFSLPTAGLLLALAGGSPSGNSSHHIFLSLLLALAQ